MVLYWDKAISSFEWIVAPFVVWSIVYSLICAVVRSFSRKHIGILDGSMPYDVPRAMLSYMSPRRSIIVNISLSFVLLLYAYYFLVVTRNLCSNKTCDVPTIVSIMTSNPMYPIILYIVCFALLTWILAITKDKQMYVSVINIAYPVIVTLTTVSILSGLMSYVVMKDYYVCILASVVLSLIGVFLASILTLKSAVYSCIPDKMEEVVFYRSIRGYVYKVPIIMMLFFASLYEVNPVSSMEISYFILCVSLLSVVLIAYSYIKKLFNSTHVTIAICETTIVGASAILSIACSNDMFFLLPMSVYGIYMLVYERKIAIKAIVMYTDILNDCEQTQNS